MGSGETRTTAAVTVTIARDPALVRTVRLVAAAVARRATQDEEFVEEVRLAVGEACALLMSAPAGLEATEAPLTVAITVGGRLGVDVSVPGTVDVEGAGEAAEVDGLVPWALLTGLIDDCRVQHEGGRTTIALSWPLP